MDRSFSRPDVLDTASSHSLLKQRPQRFHRLPTHRLSSSTRTKNHRRSIFTEVGLDELTDPSNDKTQSVLPEGGKSPTGWQKYMGERATEQQESGNSSTEVFTATTTTRWPPYALSHVFLSRVSFVAVVLAIMVPILHMSPFPHPEIFGVGADAGVISAQSEQPESLDLTTLSPRQSNTADVCLRWGHQSALVNGTLYVFGGRSKSDSNQKSDTWNSDFLTIDLTTGWQISSPTIESLPEPSGPPPVSLGYLWNSQDALFLYGGEFSDNPAESPVPFSMWSYQIPTSKWEEHPSPKTVDGEPVERSAEGSGVNVPSLGRGMYFGGHLDHFTTAGWDINDARVYLKSLLDFTFPDSSNPAINDGESAGPDGAWRNVTEGGIQESDGFTERADGVLVFVPGYGKQGILLGLAGGTNATFTPMNLIDVYDIAEGVWYKQATSGPTPKPRVNPCAVATSAADGSSVQIHLFSGQKLRPYGEQAQLEDMWILSVPSFTWIEVDMSDQSVPPGRSGHTCHVWNAQMVVVGGYVGEDLSCDSPGIYVFNTSSLTWNTEYVALQDANSLNQQRAQEDDPAALSGSYGYAVPKAVQDVIGGDPMGSATITAPAQADTAGPIATGKPIVYTVTDSNGAVATETATGRGGGRRGGDGPNVAAIAAGVAAGILAILAAYLGFCAWVYRRQLALYKHHVAMAQLQGHETVGAGLFGGGGFGKGHNSPLTKDSFDETSVSGSSKNLRHGSDGRPGNGYQHLAASEAFPSGFERASTNSGNGGLPSARSSTDDLMQGQEPSFLGVFMSPRRSLKVINRD